MSQGEKTILIVDDEPDILLFLEAAFGYAGYRVLTATTGERLFSLLARERPDLILLDMLLSGTDGRELTRQLKGQETTAQIPVLMISAHPRAEQEAQAAGADGFLAKPFGIKEILGRVTTLLVVRR
jgi:DNA-binding response OmpR family regulator